jgi:Flp pilus assembly protein TadG
MMRTGTITRGAARRGGRSFARFCRARNAAISIEVAFIIPVLVVFLLGIIEVGRALWIQTSLQYAVTVAARCASLGSSSCTNVPSYAASQAFGMSIPSGDFTYTSGASCGNAGYTAGSQVTANYTFNSVVGGLIRPLNSVPLTATACHP